jgi:hypothetical protein
MVEVGKMATCGSMMAKVNKMVTYIHRYEGDKFSIHGCDWAMGCIALMNFGRKN